ncbi:MAG TPA: FmdB family zinc ribbon protein [Pseudonocardiaceae bacterium]
MPTYAYACTECDHRFEAVQAFSDASLTACPECTGKLRKLFSSVGIVFKGSGFYRTDSRKAATSSEAGSSGSSSGSSSGKSEAAKSDSGSSASSTKSESTTSAAAAAP